LNYVDFHCHLDLYPDFPAAVRAAEAARIYTLTVTTTPRAWPRNQELTRELKFVRAALGLHPQLAAQYPNDVAMWDKYFDESRYIGEVGLDAGPKYYKSLDYQKELFDHILSRCASSIERKVLSVHSVRSATAVLAALEKHLSIKKSGVVLHWFTGSLSELQRAVAFGCYFSVNHQMLSSERGRDIIAKLPLDRVLTETDGPFTQCMGRPATPGDIPSTVDLLASQFKKDSNALRDLIGGNMKRLLA
jgi:TatD DNase family protein